MKRLSLEFVEAHPEDAARVLETQPAARSAVFLSGLPPPLAAAVLRLMPTMAAARCLERMEEDACVEVVSALGPQPASAMLPLLPEDRLRALMERLPAALAVAIRILIGYPKDSVGALMDPWALAVKPGTTVKQALDQVKGFEGEQLDCLFVLGEGDRLEGLVPLLDAVRADPHAQMGSLLVPATHRLSALAMLATVQNDPGWDQYRVLPVVERGDRFVGALSRRVLAKAPRAVSPLSPDAASDVVASLAGAYWRGVAGIIEATVALLPPGAGNGRPKNNGR